MIPMRDGVQLQTVILTPVDQTGPLPILFRRTPVRRARTSRSPQRAAEPQGAGAGRLHLRDPEPARALQVGGRLQADVAGGPDGLRRPPTRRPTPTTRIEWLVKNVPNNNGKVGMYGVSYDGLTTALTLLHPHPALKAISEQASPVDQWMNDDDHRYGALRESYAFEYAVMEQADKNKNTHFDFETYDTYEWYLDAGPALEHQREISARLDSLLERRRRASGLRRVLEEGSVGTAAARLHGAEPERRRVLGSGRSVGAVADLPPRRRARSRPHELHGGGSVVPRPVAVAQGRQHRADSARRARDGARVPRERSRRRSSATTCTARARSRAWQATTFQIGIEHAGARTPRGRRRRRSPRISICTPTARCRSSRRRPERGRRRTANMSPIPRTRCRTGSARFRRRIPAATGARWEVADQRFVDGRPDVLTLRERAARSRCHRHRRVAATLFASTSGTDADFVVKLIDVYPENAQKNAWDADDGPAARRSTRNR